MDRPEAPHPHDAVPPSADSDAGEIVSAQDLAELAEKHRAAGSLVSWLEQSHRDAAANRAQARELIRALEQVRDAQEFTGRALRDERTRTSRATAALVIVPFLAALLVWGLWDRLDALRGDVDARVAEIAAGQQALATAQAELATSAETEAQRIRAEALEAELERVRSEMADRVRATERDAAQRAAEETALRGRLLELEEEAAEATHVRAQLEALRNRSGAESARARTLEDEVRRLERELGAARVAPAVVTSAGEQAGESGGPPMAPERAVAADLPEPARTAEPASAEAARTAEAASAEAARTAEAASAEAASADVGAAGARPTDVDTTAGAVRRPADLQRIRDDLNGLLAGSTDAVRYRLDGLGGVRGETLLDVVLVGVDDNGRTVRAMNAKTATVSVARDLAQVTIDLRDGKLQIAGREAPFFNGRYRVLLTGDTEPWRVSGLSCLALE